MAPHSLDTVVTFSLKQKAEGEENGYTMAHFPPIQSGIHPQHLSLDYVITLSLSGITASPRMSLKCTHSIIQHWFWTFLRMTRTEGERDCEREITGAYKQVAPTDPSYRRVVIHQSVP